MTIVDESDYSYFSHKWLLARHGLPNMDLWPSGHKKKEEKSNLSV